MSLHKILLTVSFDVFTSWEDPLKQARIYNGAEFEKEITLGLRDPRVHPKRHRETYSAGVADVTFS